MYAHFERLEFLLRECFLDGEDEPDVLLLAWQQLGFLHLLCDLHRMASQSSDSLLALAARDTSIDEVVLDHGESE